MTARQLCPDVVRSGGSRLSWQTDLPFQAGKIHTAQQFFKSVKLINLFKRQRIFKSSLENLYALDADEFSIALLFSLQNRSTCMRKNVGRAMVGFSHHSRCRNCEHSSPVHNIIFFSSYIFSLCLFLLIETPSIVKCLAHCKYSTLVDLFFHHNSQR